MAKRLSSLFSLSRDTSGTNDNSQFPQNTNIPPEQPSIQPTLPRLQETSLPNVGFHQATPITPPTPLAPPPLLTGDGLVRPPSSAGSGYGSRPGSRAASPQSNGSRSRPTTPSIMTGSDSRPQTPTSAKLNKRKSWMPGSKDKGKYEDKKYSQAWIAGLRDHIAYDLTPLLSGERVCMLPIHEVSRSQLHR